MPQDLSYLARYQSRVSEEAYNVPAALSFPRISCGNNRFTAIDTEGNETFLSVDFIEFVAVDGNPNFSKVYYSGGYDPANTSPPSCFSENGFSPDVRVYEPQAMFCHECPKNQWGSAQSALTGKATKACSDFKKLAIYLIHDDAEGLFQFRIPSASLQNWGRYVNELKTFPTGGAFKIMPHMVVTRAQWSRSKQNVLEFERVDFLDDDWMEVIVKHQNANEYEEWLGLGQEAQQRRSLESVKIKPAPQLESPAKTMDRLHGGGHESRVIDVKPEKVAEAPARKPGRPRMDAAAKGNGQELKNPSAPAQESAMDRARRRAQEKIAAER